MQSDPMLSFEEYPPAPVRIRPVWAFNLDYEFGLIRTAIKHCPVVSLDTEFPGTVYRSEVHPRLLSPDDRYALLKKNVDGLHLIQLGLTLSDSSGNVCFVWEFNFHDFDLRRGDRHCPESVALLKSHGIDFEANRVYGIHSKRFAQLLLSSGLVLRGSWVRWVTFHGAYDFGYLIKILTGRKLPRSMKLFLAVFRDLFGENVLDAKQMMMKCDGLYGGLEKLGMLLNVKREVGQSHQAGSDSLLTLKVFMKMKQMYYLDSSKERKHQGVIFGLQAC